VKKRFIDMNTFAKYMLLHPNVLLLNVN